MHILLTRPIENSYELILKFKNLGHIVTHIPLISIEKVNCKFSDFSSFKGIIFTSANAIKNLDLKAVNKKIDCFCVGDITEKEAKLNGFQNIFSAGGNVNNLKEIILQNFENSKGKLLYVSGELTSSELDKELIYEGYNVKRVINYRAVHVEKFESEIIEKLRSKMPDIIYIYSQNSALSLLKFLKHNGLKDLCMDTNLMCMGEKTSSILNEIKWKKIFLFNPGEEEFLLYKI